MGDPVEVRSVVIALEADFHREHHYARSDTTMVADWHLEGSARRHASINYVGVLAVVHVVGVEEPDIRRAIT